VQRVSPGKKNPAQAVSEHKFVQAENSPPPTITFLMVCPLVPQERSLQTLPPHISTLPISPLSISPNILEPLGLVTANQIIKSIILGS